MGLQADPHVSRGPCPGVKGAQSCCGAGKGGGAWGPQPLQACQGAHRGLGSLHPLPVPISSLGWTGQGVVAACPRLWQALSSAPPFLIPFHPNFAPGRSSRGASIPPAAEWVAAERFAEFMKHFSCTPLTCKLQPVSSPSREPLPTTDPPAHRILSLRSEPHLEALSTEQGCRVGGDPTGQCCQELR